MTAAFRLPKIHLESPGDPAALSDGVPRSYPTQRTTGNRGYLGNRASVNDR